MDTLVKPAPVTMSARAIDVKTTNEELIINLEDGRILSVPLEWFPRLSGANRQQLDKW